MNGISGLAGVFCLIYVLSPHATVCGENARRAQCQNNLKQIALALETYRERYGTFPPAYVADRGGRRLYSWRVLILPFLDQVGLSDELKLYNQFDLHEPWDGPKNIKLLDQMPGVFGCPSRPRSRATLTSYAAIAGPGTMFPGAAPVRFADVADGPPATLMLAEVADHSIPWTAPVDLDASTMSLRINDPARPAISSTHSRSAVVAFGDSRTHFWDESTPLPRSVLTIAGGEGKNRHGEASR